MQSAVVDYQIEATLVSILILKATDSIHYKNQRGLLLTPVYKDLKDMFAYRVPD